ncbi:MAG: hypothetical protein IPJ17_10550 [Holophagales bacterium]|nr:MAG: hypothetical protein IPJ17_10550 [Holophagales bacterium]
MPIERPKPEDQRKLHAEVNQLVNQRFLLTTLSITLFGALTAWQIPGQTPTATEPLGAFRFVVAWLTVVVLFLLFFLANRLGAAIRTISTYLVVTSASDWERDIERLRQSGGHIGYTKPQAVVFLTLGVLSSAFPFVLWAAFPTYELQPRGGVLITVILGLLYIIFVSGMAYGDWFNPDREAKARWESLLGTLEPNCRNEPASRLDSDGA